MEKSYDKKKYLTLLSKEYKNINEVTEEIINLQAILNLPKGTEMFLSDIHGEYAPFEHILNNGAGIIKSKIDYIFGNTISKKERATLATLIYYPEEKLKLIKKEEKENKTASGIVLSTEKKEVPSIASVIAVGDECTSSLKENDRVIYKEYSGTKVTVADQDYIVIDEKDIIAKFE